MVTDTDLKQLDATYQAEIQRIERQRAAIIAQAINEGRSQKEVIALTGYSRETIRRLTAEGRKVEEKGSADA